MKDGDVEAVGRIWLEASLLAHEFVPAEFWHADHEVMVSEMLPGSRTWVHEGEPGGIDGFVTLGRGEGADYMGCLFVAPERQGRGIGTRLLDHAKSLADPLRTSVYRENVRTVESYRSRGFRLTGESVCEETGCGEYRMEWSSRTGP